MNRLQAFAAAIPGHGNCCVLTKPSPPIYKIAGLVVHPAFQPACYVGAKVLKAQACWDHTMEETLSPTLVNKTADLSRPESWSIWGVERQGTWMASGISRRCDR